MVLSLIFACDNCKICMSAVDNGVVEVADGGGAAICVSGVSGGAPAVVGISYGPKALVSWAKIFAVEKATNVAATNIKPVFWKPCILITSHFFRMIQHHNLVPVANHVKFDVRPQPIRQAQKLPFRLTITQKPAAMPPVDLPAASIPGCTEPHPAACQR